jgi:hypothetical protein
MQGLTTLICFSTLLVASVACDRQGPMDSDADPRSAASAASGAPQQEPDKPKTDPRQEPQKPRPGAGDANEGIPTLTGDKQKDTKAVQEALARLRTEWENNQKLLAELAGPKKNPDPERIAALKAKNDTYRARAEKLQGLLDKLREG